jgi:type IV pilus assembly protein PilE
MMDAYGNAIREKGMSLKRSGGFTLLELMIVVGVIAVLAAIAYPAYNRYGFRARRSEGQQFLMQIASAEERYFTTNNAYTSTIMGTCATCLGFVTDMSSSRSQPSYQASIALGNPPVSYTITATAQNGQAGDACGNLTLTDQNVKAPLTSSNGNCW